MVAVDVVWYAVQIGADVAAHLSKQVLVVLLLDLRERHRDHHTVLRWQGDFVVDQVFGVPQGEPAEDGPESFGMEAEQIPPDRPETERFVAKEEQQPETIVNVLSHGRSGNAPSVNPGDVSSKGGSIADAPLDHLGLVQAYSPPRYPDQGAFPGIFPGITAVLGTAARTPPRIVDLGRENAVRSQNDIAPCHGLYQILNLPLHPVVFQY